MIGKRINYEMFELGVPDMTTEAITWLDANISSSDTIFEWGSGASTFWLANKCNHIYSAEYFKAFYYYLKEQKEDYLYDNITLLLREPDAVKDSRYIAKYSSAAGLSFKNFCHSIEDYPSRSFDCVVVDGRVRAQCIHLAMKSVKRGGILVVDDTDRVEYSTPLTEYLPRFERVWHFKGKKATTGRVSQTTIARII